MKLSLGWFGNLDFEDWGRGVFAAFIGGGAGGFAAGIANIMNHPGETIWRSEFWSEVSTVFVIAGLINLMAFLRTKPIPDMKQVTTTVQTTVPKAKATVVTTVEEVKTVPVSEPTPPVP